MPTAELVLHHWASLPHAGTAIDPNHDCLQLATMAHLKLHLVVLDLELDLEIGLS